MLKYVQYLDVVLQEIMEPWQIPGLAVGLVCGGEVAYAKGFGVQSLDTQSPVTLDSIFCTTSVSKCFVTTAIMQLAERELINLDSPLVEYLPYFQMDDERYKQIKIRQMLSHTSGIPDMEEHQYSAFLSHPEWDDGASERYVRGLKDQKLIGNPGENFQYSNIAFNVLGDLIAKVTGNTFEGYLKEQVLNPAGMPNSTFLLSEVPPELLSVPHLCLPDMKVSPFYPYHRAEAPASFLHSSIMDMCHWGITCLNRGTFLDKRILSKESYDAMWKPVADQGRVRPSMYEEIGLGYTLGHYKGVKTVSHGGMGFGWSDFFLILPEQNCAAVLLNIEESFSRTEIIRALADVLLGEKPTAGEVSWMVPISQALSKGGIEAAYTCYEELKFQNDEGIYFDEDDLLGLSNQLLSVKKMDLAIDVLGLNIHVFPEHIDSYIELANLHLSQGDLSAAKGTLLRALSINPKSAEVTGLLNSIQ